MLYKTLVGVFCGALSSFSWAGEIGGVVDNQSSIHFSALFLKPNSNNLDYAYHVSGLQPYYQSWHSQMISPAYTPSFDFGLTYAIPETTWGLTFGWMHLNSSDSDSTQAIQTLDLTTLEFVGPPFEMSPPVFGVKRASSEVKFNYDTVDVNVEKLFTINPKLQATLFGGLNVVSIGEKMDTLFSDFPGVLPTPYSYALPADPSFSFQLISKSKYVGAGPDAGLNVKYDVIYGIGLTGQLAGAVTAGTTSTQEQFRATSDHLTSTGIGVSNQAITTPNKTQVVPGVDGKLGLYYHHAGHGILNFTLEGGYRFISWANAITTITPGTLVQPGTVNTTPEFSTGTMAIVSVLKQDRPFNINGPYADLRISMD